MANPNLQWLGATAANPKQYADCNIAAPSETGKEIVRRLQALLQREEPGHDVVQTGYLDAETCAAWRDYTAKRPWMRKYPGNFNITNILDVLDGASVGADGKIVHHWRCNGGVVTPDCTQVPGRNPGADPCPEGQVRDEATGQCIEAPPVDPPEPPTCPPGQQLDPTTGQCTDVPTTLGRRKKKKSKSGLLLLASAAAGAVVLALN